MVKIDPWLKKILADPVTKLPCDYSKFQFKNNVMDARIFLKNTCGFKQWEQGQSEFENIESSDSQTAESYLNEIKNDKPIYDFFQMKGRILDCGGGAGTVRQFLPSDVEFVSTDPWLSAPFASNYVRRKAYTCLDEPLNFIGANAEFLPFADSSFDWVHMRSMLDHVQVPDLVLLEAWRVLKAGGCLLIGLYVKGGKNGRMSLYESLKILTRFGLKLVGVQKWKDYHIWHPTYAELIKLITDNKFKIEKTFWQPNWNNSVCYIQAIK